MTITPKRPFVETVLRIFGVYKITFLEQSKIYIGQSSNFFSL